MSDFFEWCAYAIGLTTMLLVVVFILGVVGVALFKTSPPPPARDTGVTAELVNNTGPATWRTHDAARGATCWVTHNGISCLPDSVLKTPTVEAP
jgi:hypothetical protein